MACAPGWGGKRRPAQTSSLADSTPTTGFWTPCATIHARPAELFGGLPRYIIVVFGGVYAHLGRHGMLGCPPTRQQHDDEEAEESQGTQDHEAPPEEPRGLPLVENDR